jgi:hypothetical protein
LSSQPRQLSRAADTREVSESIRNLNPMTGIQSIAVTETVFNPRLTY